MTDQIITHRQARAARAYLGWEQKQVAAVACVSEPTVRRFELGQNDLKPATRAKIAAAFAAEGIDIVTVDGDPAIIFRDVER